MRPARASAAAHLPAGATAALALALTGCAAPPVPAAGVRAPIAADGDARPAAVVLRSAPWSFGEAPGQAMHTANYRIFTTERDSAITDRLPAFLEQALTHYRTALATLAPPTRTLDVFFMDNRPQWRRLTRWRLGRGADAFADLQRGGFSAGGVAYYFDIGARDTFAIAAHEGWHQFAQRTFRDALPVALEEGVAAYMEGVRLSPAGGARFAPWANLERFDRLRADAAADRLMPLPRLLALSPADVFRNPEVDPLTYYAQVWALAHYLNEGEGGARAASLGALLMDAQAGWLRRRAGSRSSRDLFRAYFDAVPEQMDAGYQTFIRAITATGARSAIVAGRSPLLPPQP